MSSTIRTIQTIQTIQTRCTLAIALSIFSCATRSTNGGAAQAEPRPTAHAIRTARPSDDVLRRELTPLQYDVTQRAGTEAPFHNGYWDNHASGLYVDIVTGEPLFSSLDKFDSGTGWPSFTQPLAKTLVLELHDGAIGIDRTEVRSKLGDSHLGHVFDDGPAPTGQRYCINSASLRFVPADQLVREGYAAFAPLFAKR